LPETYHIYDEFGRALGSNPECPDPVIGSLTSAVVSLDQASFYHFGTNRSLLASVNQLCSSAAKRPLSYEALERLNSSPVILHSSVPYKLSSSNRYIWIDNSIIPPEWKLSERHVLTNIPANDWNLELSPGICLDFQYMDGSWCIRNYGFDDCFSGPIDSEKTGWMEGKALSWMEVRGINLEDAGIAASCDILDAELFSLVDPEKVSGEFIQWLLDSDPPESEVLRKLWLQTPRVSGRDLLHRADFLKNWEVRHGRIEKEVREGERIFDLESYDLGEIAELIGNSGSQEAYASQVNGLEEARFRMLLSESARINKNPEEAHKQEKAAFSGLRRLLIDQVRTEPRSPSRNVQEDQIVWGRSPVRFDLAGGWTDTPPYCLYYGGKVVNLAADLNGQSPIQVFARISKEPRILMRSIDLGLDKRIETFEELLARNRLGGGFGIARACLELAGFSPEFNLQSRFSSLRHLLETSTGGGIELSMVAALPRGSGLGTSSILASTILGTLSELCGLNWSREDIYSRTLAVEQMMNLGGGWQDQVGGLYGGVKLIESEPGLEQRVSIRTLPDSCFDQSRANVTVLLYYTGITRVAHNILGEVVRGVFLNNAEHMNRLRDIGTNALFASDALQRGDMDLVCEAVRRGWKLKQDLDPGTNPPEVNRIVESIKPYTRACTLSGAGGGGYLLIFAGDVNDAGKIKSLLTQNPPNNKARFVDFQLSHQGFQVSRS
ncbi:MAG: bifunctional fucokinase/L-fucose-1-P-guanylyltransferase, partial [Acidobacteriota bacterium]